MKPIRHVRSAFILWLALLAAVLGGAGDAVMGLCGPFVDVSDSTFCPLVLEIFTLGITTGTTPTTYSPGDTVTRLQMAAFLSRTVDGVLRRGSRRAALDQFWTPQAAVNIGLTTVGVFPVAVASDGSDLWVANHTSSTVSRVRGSDGKLLETWTGTWQASGVLSAMGTVFVTGNGAPGNLYRIDPSQPAGDVTTVASNLGNNSASIAFDGSRIWTANGSSGSVSIVTPGSGTPWTVTTVTTGFFFMGGIVYDGANIWVANQTPGAGGLLKLDSAGAILQTVTVGLGPHRPAFDGTNIWVPNFNEGSLTVVRASTGAVLATFTDNGLSAPNSAAFDGQRILVTSGVDRVSLWKAADLTPLGAFGTGADTFPLGSCSDGINFWITLRQSNKLARF